MSEKRVQKHDRNDSDEIERLQKNWNKNIKDLLILKGWSKRMFAAKLSALAYETADSRPGSVIREYELKPHFHERSVYRWIELGGEGGTVFPSFENMRLIAKCLNVDLAVLLRDKTTSSKTPDITVRTVTGIEMAIGELRFAEQQISDDGPGGIRIYPERVLEDVVLSRNFSKLLFRIALLIANEHKPLPSGCYFEAIDNFQKDADAYNERRAKIDETVRELIYGLIPQPPSFNEYLTEKAKEIHEREQRRHRQDDIEKYGEPPQELDEQEPLMYTDNW